MAFTRVNRSPDLISAETPAAQGRITSSTPARAVNRAASWRAWIRSWPYSTAMTSVLTGIVVFIKAEWVGVVRDRPSTKQT